MNRVAYIQTDEQGQPYSVNGAAAARGFALLGYDVRYFHPDELPDLLLGLDTIVVGGMGTVREALKQIGVRPPSHVSAPAVLYPYLGRDCWRTTILEVREAGRFPVFLKPYEDAKVFTGQVVHNFKELNGLVSPRPGFPPVSEEFALLAQEPVTFVSEWRVFVVRQVVVGMSFYKGDPFVFPSAGAIRVTMGAYQGAPAGYSADFGVTDEGRTLLVEVNDGYSLGHGGLVANLYAELLKARWEELTEG